MPLLDTCRRCADLWGEYGAATRDHVDLLKEQERSAGVDPQSFQDLEPTIEIAEARRDAARNAVKYHLAMEHQTGGLTMTAQYHPKQ